MRGLRSSRSVWARDSRLRFQVVVLAVVFATTARAQPAGRTQVRCNGQPITELTVRTQAPNFGGVFARSPVLAHLVSVMHVTTAPEVIERFALLRRGEPCSALRRYETERVLRAQPFLADASVTAFPDGLEGVRIEIVTIDEPSIVASLGVKGESPLLTRLTLGSGNVAGKGVYALAGWRDGGFYRDALRFDYGNYQMFGKPWQFALRGTRRELGAEWESQFSLPFFSDVQRYAWQVAAGSSREYIPFRSLGEPRRSVGMERSFFDAGGVFRVGRPGKLGLLGASVSHDLSSAEQAPIIVTDTGAVPDGSAALVGRFSRSESTRFNALLGFRAVNFLEVTGFDALNGRQDMRRGVQIGTTLGTGLPVGGEHRDRLYVAVDVYAGVGTASSFAAMQWRAEGHRRVDGDQWEGLLTAGRIAWYRRPHPKHTILTDVLWGSGWRQSLPFQLALGDRRGGVRAFRKAEVGGGRRVVGRVEERWRLGSFRGTADAGLAFFTDVGRLWANGAPLGITSRTVQSVGMGLLAAVPPRSRRTWRVDLAVPLRRDYGAKWEVRFSNEDRARTFFLEPNDIRRNRERSVPASVFVWP